MPPYHPDYESAADGEDPFDSDSSNSSEDEYLNQPVRQPKGPVRRGSEGYEIQPIDREEMLRRYIEGQSAEVGRYNVYVPEPDVDSESDGVAGSELDDEIPLAEKVENWRATADTKE